MKNNVEIYQFACYGAMPPDTDFTKRMLIKRVTGPFLIQSKPAQLMDPVFEAG
jgi:hypothetical protein